MQWLADGRLKAEWNVAASVMLNARLAVNNESKLSVMALVPERYRDQRPALPKTEKQIEEENRLAWLGIHHLLTDGNPMLAVNDFEES